MARRGLKLDPPKCKVPTNICEWQLWGEVEIEDGFAVEVLHPDANLFFLGMLLNLADRNMSLRTVLRLVGNCSGA